MANPVAVGGYVHVNAVSFWIKLKPLLLTLEEEREYVFE